jgi:hypothetical protein
MSLGFESFSLKQISTDLGYVEKWLSDKGIAVTENRFAETKESMLTISTLYEQGKLNDLPPVWGNEKIIASILEATSFVNIYKAFNDLPDHLVPRNSLKKAMTGSYLSQTEDATTNTNEARNFLFELELAAHLASNGVEILDFDDITFELDDTVWNIQCKRPMYDRNIDGHIEKAVQQGINFFDREKSKLVPRGIIAISVDKILGSDKTVIRTFSADTLNDYLSNKLKEFVRQNEHKWQRKTDNRILAVLFFVRAVVETKNPSLTIGPIKYFGIDYLISPSTHKADDALRFQSFAKLLTTGTS